MMNLQETLKHSTMVVIKILGILMAIFIAFCLLIFAGWVAVLILKEYGDEDTLYYDDDDLQD